VALFATRTLAAIAAFALCALIPPPAGATGTINIQRTNGTKNTYRDVKIKIFSGSLFLTSDDGNGTIVVTRAACSYQGAIMVCFPTAATLVQEGESNALNLKNGTIYLNATGDAQQMTRSTAKIPANSVLLALTLKDGTFIDVRGRIDEVVSQ
jgi:hypothetical protein